MKRLLEKIGIQDRGDYRPVFWQFFKFGLVGLSNTAVSMAVYYLILWLNNDWYMLGSVLGAILSIANAFLWNDRFVFKSKLRDLKNVLKRLGKTYVSYGGTSLLSTALLWLEVSWFGVDKVLAPVVNLLITIPLNFILNKLWAFR